MAKQSDGAGRSKSHVDYWKARLFHPSYTRDGQRIEVADYAVRIMHAGRRETFNLGTANAAAAASTARDIHRMVVGAGWEAALAKFKPKPQPKAEVATVGDLIAAAGRVAVVKPRSLALYSSALRQIAADIGKVSAPSIQRATRKRADGKPGNPRKTKAKVVTVKTRTNARFAYRSPEFRAWRAKVDALPLDEITAERVAAWRAARVAAKADPTDRASAKISADSTIRSAKALFGRKLLPHLSRELTLPDPLPFAGVSLGKSAKRFRADVSAQWLFAAAKAELSGGNTEQREVWKAFALCLLGGLRRAEADTLTWSQLKLEDARIEIRRTEHFAPKSSESERDVDLSADAVHVLRQFKSVDADPMFVLRGGAAKPAARYEYYRADCAPWRTWTRLSEWLQGKGVKAKKPVHALRKLAGSLIHEAFGIEAARDFLGHADIATTSASYVSKRPRVAVSFAS